MNNNNQVNPFDKPGKAGKASPLDQYSNQPPKEKEDSPFYKSAAPTIAMPKGGGALKGIDEKFSVNAVNGTASVDVPLPLSAGRNGFTPALSLSYNSGSGNSPFGLGWGISLPSIQRRTDKKLPLYDDVAESDVFLLAGAEDLIPELDDDGNKVTYTFGDYSIKRYRPRIEGLFARIEYVQKTGVVGGWWRVTTKENITSWYGLTSDARITDPENDHRIFKWLPQISMDHKGNVQQFTYLPEDNHNIIDGVYEKNRQEGIAPYANTYLKSVRYCNKLPFFVDPAAIYEPILPGNLNFLMEAVLDYGDHSNEYTSTPDQQWAGRSDAFSDFHAGFEIRTYRKCKRVLMFHHFTELNGKDLMRSLELQYQNDLTPGVTMTEADFIVAAIQKGYEYKNNSWHSKALPPMSFDYEPLQWNTQLVPVSRDNFNGAPQGLTGPYQWTDFEGEGIPGILSEQASGWFYKNNLGNGQFAPPKAIALKPSFNGLSNGSLQWQDLNADGSRQVVTSDTVKGFWELDDDNKWQNFSAFAKNINIDWNSPFTKMLDLDGDGRADVLITEDRAWTWYESLGTEGFDNGGYAPVYTDEEKGPMLLLRDTVQCIFLADMSGDGMTDLVRIKNGQVCYWPNKGYGRFGAKVTMANAPLFDTEELYNPAYLVLADISGTGAADIIYAAKDNCTAWINFSGNGWSDAQTIGTLPEADQYSKIAVLDFMGNGTACIVWSSPLPGYADAPLRYIDLMGGNKPYLMRSYSNGMGKVISVTYKSSAQFYLDDKLAGISWATKLPFPVHCISSIKTSDVVTGTDYTQTYKYRHGYYDHEEREFRGFGYVETLDIESAATAANTELDQPQVLTKLWNHTGAWMRSDALLSQFQQEYYEFEGWDKITVIADFPEDMNAQEHREAHRALKGLQLRQEVYALDGNAAQNIPYAVTASAYTVAQVQPLKNNRYASFFCYPQQNIAFNCERNMADPRIMQQVTLETDQYGNVLQSAQVAYPRKHTDTSLPLKVQQEQAKMHITYTRSVFTNDVIDDTNYTSYCLRKDYKTEVFEVNLTPVSTLWTVGTLGAAITASIDVQPTQVPATGQKRIIQSVLHQFYADDAQTVLPLGSLDALALAYESYQLAYTPDIVSAAYGTKVTAAMLEEGGFVNITGQSMTYHIPSGVAVYTQPETKFYTPETFTDPWGKQTQVSYWGNYWLLPASITDAKGNVSSVESYDWRILQPTRIKDANLNYSEILYDTLGMTVAMAVKGKDNGTEGDDLSTLDIYDPADISAQDNFFTTSPENNADALLKNATWRCMYKLDTMPVAVGMIARQHSVHNPVIVTGQGTDRVIRISYSDGMGRLLMHKGQCEPVAENNNKSWVGTGRTIYNNKGSVVMQFEPYFSDTHLCDSAVQAANLGVSPKMYYDPLNRLFKTELPDGSFAKTDWTAWQVTHFDNNDTVKDSSWYTAIQALPSSGSTPDETDDIQARKDAATKAAAHYNTPEISHTDTLARHFYSIQMDSTTHQLHSYANLDIMGSNLSVVDSKRITANPDNDPFTLQYRYNLVKQICYQKSIDSGEGFVLTDVAGQALYAWDAENRKTRIVYDPLRRVTQKWLNDTILLEKMNYGEGMTDDTAKNMRGQLYEHYDSSGRQWIPEGYDFKGNPVKGSRCLVADRTLTDADWSGAGPGLSAETFTIATVTDALNRPVRTTDPGGNITELVYERSGALKLVRLNGSNYVNDIHYDSNGQRSAIWYGNGTKTGYTYDPKTYKLTRLLTVNVDTTSSHYNEQLQDLNYYYDPAGNITRIRDKAQQTIFFNNTVVSPTQSFIYDALYRLTEATGRELTGIASFGANDNYTDQQWMTSHKGNGNAVQTYTQKYVYDAVGNIMSLQHIAATGSYTRTYTYSSGSNRLATTTVDTDYNYTYDGRGNMAVMPHLQLMKWNAVNELCKIGRGTSMTAWYQSSGRQRTRKYVEKDGSREERLYFGSYEIYRKLDSLGAVTLERTTVHISDDAGRIAMLETRTKGTDDSPAQLPRYCYSNHLGSAALELDDHANVISYEEYHPYGTTSYQAMNATINAVAKRYRFTGKERDDESGLYYHGARYYIPWLCRWTANDPLENKYAGTSPYNYGFNNPVKFNDPNGMEGDDPQKAFEEGEKQTQKGFEDKLKEIANSKADPAFKKWMADMGLAGVVDFRNQLFMSKISALQNAPGARAIYGWNGFEGNGVAIPEYFRQKFWTEANEEAIPTLKATWAAQQSGYDANSFGDFINPFARIGYMRSLALTVSNKKEGWDIIKSVGIQVGIDWALHLTAYTSFVKGVNARTTGFMRYGSDFEYSVASKEIKNYRIASKLKGKNVAYAEGNLTGAGKIETGMVQSRSGAEALQAEAKEGFVLKPSHATSNTTGKSWYRSTDSEFIILDNLAKQLGGKSGVVNKTISGRLTLVSENIMCSSCSSVVTEFHEMFPNIRLTIIHGVR